MSISKKVYVTLLLYLTAKLCIDVRSIGAIQVVASEKLLFFFILYHFTLATGKDKLEKEIAISKHREHARRLQTKLIGCKRLFS